MSESDLAPTAAATIRRARTGDRTAIEGLLQREDLPVEGVGEMIDRVLVAEVGDRIVGAIGREDYEPHAFLRSAVVAPDHRGTGLGRRLVDRLLAETRAEGRRTVYLLTTTAESWFARFGFVAIDRAEVPAAVRRSVEFQGACPASAIAMRLELC